MHFKNSIISVALASMLLGCGGGGDGSTPVATPAPTVTPTLTPTATPTPVPVSEFNVNANAAIEKMESKGWMHAAHLDFLFLSSKNGKLIVATQEHNGLGVVDMNEKSMNFTALSTITDVGYNVPSVSVDASSGASEPSMRGAVLTSDASSIYFNVPRGTSTSNKDILGLFKVDIEADGSIKTETTDLPNGPAERIVASGLRLEKTIRQFYLAPDDSKVITYDNESVLRLYAADLVTVLGETDDTSVDGLESLCVSKKHVYTAVSGSNNITKRGISGTLDSVASIDIGFTPDEMIMHSDGSKMLAFTHGEKHRGITNIALIDLATDALINSGYIAHASATASVSPDFKTLAISGSKEAMTNIIDLEVQGFALNGTYAKDARNDRNTAFIANNQLALTSAVKGIDHIFIIDIAKNIKSLSIKDEMAKAVKVLEEVKEDGARRLSDVIKKLSGFEYKNIDIAWTSTLFDNVLNEADNISIIEEGKDPEVVENLTATLTSSSGLSEEVKLRAK